MMSIPSAEYSAEQIVDTMHGVAKEYIPRKTFIGVVIKPPPNFEIKANNIILTKENAYISKRLLPDYYREAKGHIKSATQNKAGGGGDASFASHNHGIDNDYTMTFIYTDTLKIGDWVSIIPCEGLEGQTYLINEEVIRL